MKTKLNIIWFLALALRVTVQAVEDPPNCSLIHGGLGNTSLGGLHFIYSQAHVGDTVPAVATLGMVSGACRAINANGSIWIATGRLTDFLVNVTLNPGALVACPTDLPCQPGLYNVLITPALVRAGVSSPNGNAPGVPKTVRAIENGTGTVLTGDAPDELLDFHTVSIAIVTPCIQVVKTCAYPPNSPECFPAGANIDFTGYVTNCGDIRLTNVTLVDSRSLAGAGLLDTNGLPLLQPLTLNPGQAIGFRGSFGPTLTETCARLATSTITARGTDTTAIGGPNASVTNSATVSCAICPAPCLILQANPTITGGLFRLSFASIAGRTNTVEYTDALSPAKWAALSNFLGDGSLKTISDPVSKQQRFYRVLVR